MNGSRQNTSRQGDRSSLDALNRTIEGLEARIEDLIAGGGRDPRHQPANDPRIDDQRDLRMERRPAPPPTQQRAVEQRPVQQRLADPRAEIRERQRMLEANRDFGHPVEQPARQAESQPRLQPRSQPDSRPSGAQTVQHVPVRREEAPYREPRRADPNPPGAYHAQERQPAPRQPVPRQMAPRQPAPRPETHGEERRIQMPQPRVVQQPRQPVAAPPAENGIGDIVQTLANLRQELKHEISSGVAREMNTLRDELRSIRTVAADHRFADDLRGDLARLAEGIDQLGHQATPEAAGLRAEFEELRALMNGLAREDSMTRMETRWQSLEDRMHRLEPDALREELVALAYRIDDIKSQFGGQFGRTGDSPMIQALENKLITLATAVEQLGSRMRPNDEAISEQFATLDERLDEISRAIAAGSRMSAEHATDQAFLQRLEGRIEALSDQIDDMSRANEQRVDPNEALSIRIEALTGRIEELADEQTTTHLEERLDHLSTLLQQIQQSSTQQIDVADYLADISGKIDGLGHGALNDTLTERLDLLARRIEEIDFQPRQPAMDEQSLGRIEERLSDIAARMDETTAAPRNDESALRSLESQIAHLSTLISEPQNGNPEMSREFDDRMSAIENYMATSDEYIVEAARQAAEAVVEAYSRNAQAGAPVAASDMAALSALADDLRHLEELTRGSEERTHRTFESLHDTLVQIATRLDGLEGRSGNFENSAQAAPRQQEPVRRMAQGASAMAADADYEDEAELRVAHSDADEIEPAAFGTRSRASDAAIQAAASEAFSHVPRSDLATAERKPESKPSLLNGLSRLLPGGKGEAGRETGNNGGRAVVEPAPSIDPTDVLPADHENDLLEPGSGAPDVRKILERVRASQAAGEFAGKRSGADAPDRADYIAAARRAAQAAAQETDPVQPSTAKKGKGKTTKASSQKSLSQYRRPILMAVGAILLALMAVPFAQKVISTVSAPSTEIAQLETPPAEPARPVPPAIEQQPAVTAEMSGDTAADGGSLTPSDGINATDGGSSATANSDLDASRLAAPEAATGPAVAERVDEQTAEIDVAAPIVVPAEISPKSLADAAAAGDPNALFEIAARYTEGRGVETDPAEAANWYKLAADRGLAPAQYRLANLFEKGTGVARDVEKAAEYYRKAADAGNASAMHNLAVLYASGTLGSPDYAAAVKWFAKAADLGVSDSQFNLAILYARGNGTSQDLEESYKWFAIAARDGDKDAAQKRDEVANAMRKEQLESARAKVDLWKVQPLDPKANTVNSPEEWVSGKPLTTASVDMEKAVRNIQAILNKNGFDAGPADGKVGPQTVSAIKAFQKSVGQEPSGKINDALVKELLARNK